MTDIFIETGSEKTSEYVFVKTYLKHIFENMDQYKIQMAGGKDTFKELSLTLKLNKNKGINNIILFDADTSENGGGFAVRQKEILAKKQEYNIDFDLFLFPNNEEDGCFETLLSEIINPKHQSMLNCFYDYESCLKINNYYSPNLKTKVYAYISSMNISKEERKNIGKGDWLFDNKEYWDLDSPYLEPLKCFLRTHIK